MSQELLDGRFRIGHVIGKGNMGEVHRAEDLQAAEGTPERTVAVKTILRRRTGTRVDTGAPFIWNEDRRAQLRAELDAYFLHLYGVAAEDAEHILESFQSENGGLKDNEIAKYGEYRTKRLVLAEYGSMAKAGLSLENPLVDGETYTSALTPRPGQGPRRPLPSASQS